MFKSIGHKLILTFAGISAVGLMLLAWFYIEQQKDILYRQNERMMGRVSQGVIEGLQTLMLAGYADAAREFTAKQKNVEDVVDLRILRVDGSEALLDNKTINDVNRRMRANLFESREKETTRQILPVDSPELQRAVKTGQISKIYGANESGEKYLTFIAPIKNREDCNACHGDEQPIRGVVKITASLLKLEQAVASSRNRAYLVTGLLLLLIVLVIGFMVNRRIVHPINQITTAMTSASLGDLGITLALSGSDELSNMARSFNRMSRELKSTYQGFQEEHDKLTTLILSARDGMVVTDRQGMIVLTNPAAVEILNKSADDIFLDGFTHLFDDPEIMQSAIDEKGYIELSFGDRELQVLASTTSNQDQETIGSAALIRDVTTEKRLQEELRHLATSDALTGLYNRRHLDTSLANELNRSIRYGHELSIIMFDVDHFKLFNDQHGHDQGDRVLQCVADTVKGVIRNLDIPCRYGGEEFVVILPETNHQAAMIVAERVRTKVERTSIDGLSVTISIGLATYPQVMAADHQRFIEAADKALYEAKKAGRNCLRSA